MRTTATSASRTASARDAAVAAVRQHSQAAIPDRDALLAALDRAVDRMAGPITAAALARLDQFHFGGLAATAALAQATADRRTIGPTMRVLDAGSGLGGPARYLAETFEPRRRARAADHRRVHGRALGGTRGLPAAYCTAVPGYYLYHRQRRHASPAPLAFIESSRRSRRHGRRAPPPV